LVVANHVSWLDIFVINSLFPSRFVAKSDIRDWPLIGWLCARAGTVFISRGSLRDVRRIFQDLVSSIHDGDHVAFFPEGTTSTQGALAPFHANLFEAAIDAKAPVQPYALRYLDVQGRFHPTVDFVGDMSFAESLLAILRGDEIVAQLIVLPLIETTGAHRRDLARTAQQAIADALGHAAK
jgi:1-acyl-sn-glycerol-3-phosphate acyltransferase